jgi:hypothetical protein
VRPEGALRAALARRLAEVQGHAAADHAAAAPAADPEETLRLVMVRLWPAARRTRSPNDVQAWTDALQTLTAAARGDDLRFLDAWNVAWEELPRVGADRALIAAPYAALLEHHLERG